MRYFWANNKRCTYPLSIRVTRWVGTEYDWESLGQVSRLSRSHQQLRYRAAMDDDRDELVALLQAYAGEAERLSQVFADRHDMHVTDLYALLAVMQADRAGHPLTPGRLGAHLGLSSGATTAVIDRLERAEHVRRTRDDPDRRRVTLRYGAAAGRVGTAFFGPLGTRMDVMLEGYDAAELAAARRFLTDANALMRAYRDEVTGATSAG